MSRDLVRLTEVDEPDPDASCAHCGEPVGFIRYDDDTSPTRWAPGFRVIGSDDLVCDDCAYITPFVGATFAVAPGRTVLIAAPVTIAVYQRTRLVGTLTKNTGDLAITGVTGTTLRRVA